MSWPFLEQNTHLRVLIGFSGAGRRLVDLAMSVSLVLLGEKVRYNSEGWLVVAAGERTRRRGTAPRVVTAARGGPAAAALGGLAGSAAAEATAATATAAGLIDLRGGVLQARTDLVDLELDHRPLLAL